jgi:methylenetetrahydrofolate reductase (NADPH)
MCFDAGALRRWIEHERDQGMTLPVLIGMPGKTSRRRLITMATRIGVGPSIRFLRRLRGLRSLLARRSTADRLYEETAPLLAEPGLGIAGFQYFTFNALTDTWRWHQRREEDPS